MLLLHHALLPRPMAGAGGLVLVETETAFLGTLTPSKMADPKGLTPSAFPQTTGCSAIELRVHMKWWEAVVMLHSSLPTFFCDTGFTDQQPERFP